MELTAPVFIKLLVSRKTPLNVDFGIKLQDELEVNFNANMIKSYAFDEKKQIGYVQYEHEILFIDKTSYKKLEKTLQPL